MSSCELLGTPWVLTNNIFAYFITFYMSLSTGHACTSEKSQHAYLWDDPDQDCDPRSLGSWYAKEQIHESTQGKDSLVNWMRHVLNKLGSLILIHVHCNPKGMHHKIKVASVYYKWCRDLIPNWAFYVVLKYSICSVWPCNQTVYRHLIYGNHKNVKNLGHVIKLKITQRN